MISRLAEPPAPTADERLSAYLLEMADLLSKRESLRAVYRHLQTSLEDHPNLCHFLKATERAVGSIDRRIDLITLYLRNGVL
jgi:hypothetical protein